jgi:hypothetical protein
MDCTCIGSNEEQIVKHPRVCYVATDVEVGAEDAVCIRVSRVILLGDFGVFGETAKIPNGLLSSTDQCKLA